MRRASALLFLGLALPLLAGDLDEPRRLIGENRGAEARRMLEQLPGPATAGRLELLTEACNLQGDHAAGIRYGKEAVRAAADSSNAHLQYAVAVRQKMQNVGKVKAMFVLGTYKKTLRRALELDPRNVEALEEQIGFLAQAPGFAGGDVELAREKVVELEALDRPRGRLMLAYIERDSGNPEAAEAIYRELLAERPERHDVRRQLAFSLQGRQRYREADAEFQFLAQASEPRVALAARYQLARNRILGAYDLDHAIELLNGYIRQLPEGADGLPSASHAHWRIGNAHEGLQRPEQARAAYRRALELDDGNDEARKALRALPRS